MKTGEGYRCSAAAGCEYRPKTLNQSNWVRHVREQHPHEFNALELGKRLSDDEIERKRSKVVKAEEDPTAVVRLNRKKFVGGLIKLVTLHACPFNALQWEGLQDIVEPGLEAFNLRLNRNNMPALVALTSDAIDKAITQEVDWETLAVKFDTTIKLHRSVLGVSVQFFKELTLTNRCLGKYIS